MSMIRAGLDRPAHGFSRSPRPTVDRTYLAGRLGGAGGWRALLFSRRPTWPLLRHRLQGGLSDLAGFGLGGGAAAAVRASDVARNRAWRLRGERPGPGARSRADHR